jgi:hypothetical protein
MLGLLALLANQALFPVLHLATAGSSIHQIGDSAGSHHDARSNPSKDTDPGAGHQVCHFCRFGAVVLAPPAGVAADVFFAQGLVWVAADEAARPRERFRSGGLARAPPLIA